MRHTKSVSGRKRRKEKLKKSGTHPKCANTHEHNIRSIVHFTCTHTTLPERGSCGIDDNLQNQHIRTTRPVTAIIKRIRTNPNTHTRAYTNPISNVARYNFYVAAACCDGWFSENEQSQHKTKWRSGALIFQNIFSCRRWDEFLWFLVANNFVGIVTIILFVSEARRKCLCFVIKISVRFFLHCHWHL